MTHVAENVENADKIKTLASNWACVFLKNNLS
jgi:hypothetical protein